MSQSNSNSKYVWDASYKRYQIHVYDYSTKQWVFSEWAAPQQEANPQSSRPSASVQYARTPDIHQNHHADSGAFGSSPAYDPTFSTTPSPGYVQPPGHYALPQNLAPVYPYGSSITSAEHQQSFSPTPHTLSRRQPIQRAQRANPRGQGTSIDGTYDGKPGSHYELVDPSFYVRDKSWFFEGRVFAVIMNETAGSTTRANAVDYTTASINAVRYRDNLVYTNVRRFVVVRQRPEFCFACPIFTYSGRATTKYGVRPAEHSIVYSWGQQPKLLDGEYGITKTSIGVVMARGESTLHVASRIYFGIHHPIQYNVKVKEIGYIPQDHVPTLIGNWREEDDREERQNPGVTANAELPELDDVPEYPPESTGKGKAPDTRYH